jgi:hypothetical protein
MEPASLFQDKPLSEQRALTIFRMAMIAREEANWKDLFDGSLMAALLSRRSTPEPCATCNRPSTPEIRSTGVYTAL